MIVTSLADGWEVVYQRSHANLAAMLVSAWKKSEHVPRWTELLIATAQHDDQEMFWSESNHLTEIGAPIDFMQNDLETINMQARYVIENAYRQGLWIALLISRHNSELYEPMRGQDPHMDAFLDEQRDKQERWRKELGYTKKEVEGAYAFVRFGDRMSLTLCRRELPEAGRAIDIAPTPDGTMIRASQRADERVTLDPWPFEEREVTFSVEVRKLNQLKFNDEAEFERVLADAAIEHRKWTFAK